MSTELTAPTTVGVDPITTALVAAGVPSSRIEALAKDYGSIAADIQIIQSAEDYELVKRAQLACRDVRTAVIAALKEEREEAKRYQTFVISEEKRILAEIAKTEDPLKKLREDYDKREELKAQEEARQWVEKMNLRKQAAFDVGYYFNGQAYLLDRENGEAPWVLREDQIAGMAMSDEALYALLEAQAAELKMTREIKAEAEAKAEEERLAAEAEQRRKDEEAAAKLAEIERREKEMQAREAAMNAKVNEARKNELLAIGMVQRGNELVVGDGHTGVLFVDVLHGFLDSAWPDTVKRFAEACSARDTQAIALREQQEQERIAREEQMKAEAAEEALRQERLRVAAEQERQKKQEELLAQQAAEKALQASDKEKAVAFGSDVLALIDKIPALKSAIGKSAMKSYEKQLRDLFVSIDKLRHEL